MTDKQSAEDAATFVAHVRQLRANRRTYVQTQSASRPKRQPLSASQRREILKKTGKRCHLCGGEIESSDLEMDHVLAHSGGGAHAVDNYLPAHSLCNNYRWDYGSEEFQLILKLGVWLRTQIEKQTLLGKLATTLFVSHENRRKARRKPPKRSAGSS